MPAGRQVPEADDILWGVRTTLDINDALLERAINAVTEDRLRRKDTTTATRTGVIELGLEALLRQFASQRLAAAYGAEPAAAAPRRRRVR